MSDRHRRTGSLKELVLLFLPIAIISFSNFLFLLIEKLLLARLSMADMEAAISAAYAWQIFLGSSVALALMSQVYIGRCWGAKDLKGIGPGVWQFIWFSLFSILISVPLGMLYGHFYFKNTEIEGIVLPYYYFLLSINFLFPLATALASFYIAQGKTRLVLWTTLAVQVIKVCLAYVLILGWGDWVVSRGMMGGPISTLVSQGVLCIVLFGVFLNSKHAKAFHSREWRFKPKLFWECIYPGLMRASCRVLTFLCWASIARLMTAKGGDYLLVLSIGGAIFLFIPFLGDAIFQAQTTIASQILGARHHHLLNRAFGSGALLVSILVGISAIPFVILPSATFHVLFPDATVSASIIRNVFLGVWLSFAFFTLGFVPISHVLALKDAKFSFLMGFVNWINGYLLMYVAIKQIDIAADHFWFALSLMHGSTTLIYYWRMRWLQSKLSNTTNVLVKEMSV